MVVFLVVWGVVVSVSLVTLVAYVVLFAVTVVKTAHRRSQPDPLAAELDAVLAEILARPMTSPPSGHGPSASR